MSDAKDDIGVLNKPAKMSQRGIHQIIVYLNQGSREVRDLLIHECDTIFECKVCKSLFRSLANFIVHKRGFCKEHCCENMLLFENCDIPKECSITVVDPDGVPETIDSDQDGTPGTDNFQQTELITSKAKIYSPLLVRSPEGDGSVKKIAEVPTNRMSFKKCLDEITSKVLKRDVSTHVVKLKSLPTTRSAVMQALYRGCDSEKAVDAAAKESGSDADTEMDADSMTSSKSVKHHDRCLTMADRLKLRDDCSVATLTCRICKYRFSSIKSLNRHMKNQHNEHKMYYPCPCCTDVFVEMNALGDHLVSSHNKSDSQAKKLESLARSKRFLREIDSNSNQNKVDVHAEDPTGTVSLCPRCGCCFDQVHLLTSHLKSCKSTGNERRSCVANSYGTDSALTHRPRRVGVEKKVAADFVNSQTLNWRNGSTNTRANSTKISSVKKLSWSSDGKNAVSISKRFSPDVMENKVSSYLNLKTLGCRLCRKRFSSTSNLRRHVAIHLGWNRFRCKMCSFQAYNKFDVRVHVLKQHTDKTTTEDNVNNLVADLKVRFEDAQAMDKKSKLNKCKTSPVGKAVEACRTKNAVDGVVPTMKIKMDKSGKVGHITTNAGSCGVLAANRKEGDVTDNAKSSQSVNPSMPQPGLEGDNMSTLKTRSGSYLKEDRMLKFREETAKDESKVINDDSSTQDEASDIDDDVDCKTKPSDGLSKRPLKSLRAPTKRKRVHENEPSGKLIHTNIQEIKMNAIVNTSSDEGEPRVSKRKQSFSNVLIDENEEVYASPVSHKLSPKKSSISRSSSLTNLRDPSKGLSSPLSRTNPNSPMRGPVACGAKLVISDDLGRVVREVPVGIASPKKNKRKEMIPTKTPIVGTALNFDKAPQKGPRLQNIGLLRKLKTTTMPKDGPENPPIELDPSVSSSQ